MVEEKRGMLVKLLEYLDKPEVPLPKLTQVSGLKPSEVNFFFVRSILAFLTRWSNEAQKAGWERCNDAHAVKAERAGYPEIRADCALV